MRSPVDPEAAVAYGLFSWRQAREAGYTKSGIELRIRRSEWARCGHGVLRVVGRTEQRGDELLLHVLRCGPAAVASHLSAAVAHGWDLVEEPRRPQVIVPRQQRKASPVGVHVRRQDLARSDVTHVGVLPATVPLRTAIDIAASEDEVAAVVAIDSGLRMRQFTVEAVRAELRGRRHLPTRPKAEVVIGLVDPTSGSVPESMARVLFGRAGLPTPVPQFPIRLGNGRIAYADFAWPEHRLVVEIDGFAWHSSNEALQRDHSRQNQLQLAGWTILRYTAKDIRQRMPSVLDEVRQALGR